eukprot:CAMPEP_0206409094 /NCGR_PEP_ID=MMETSP0294-20121207/31623_1 /ASSEMBLY_ACC=CAM_ASM_000327 /TAXON_ID=39354 /ORGANISM="Heterosigma akashiwo, Strain CCMP2393" /LENGTH=57 /DNA_ID=CAMNT_0053868845 /DNA_START=34 /DNA_END=204 /DNA_ORIENTATION=+
MAVRLRSHEADGLQVEAARRPPRRPHPKISRPQPHHARAGQERPAATAAAAPLLLLV